MKTSDVLKKHKKLIKRCLYDLKHFNHGIFNKYSQKKIYKCLINFWTIKNKVELSKLIISGNEDCALTENLFTKSQWYTDAKIKLPNCYNAGVIMPYKIMTDDCEDKIEVHMREVEPDIEFEKYMSKELFPG